VTASDSSGDHSLQKATLTGATHAMRARTDVCRCQEKRFASGGTVL